MKLSNQIAAYLKHAEDAKVNGNTLRMWASVLHKFLAWVRENELYPTCIYCDQQNLGDAVAATICPLNPHGRHHVFKDPE